METLSDAAFPESRTSVGLVPSFTTYINPHRCGAEDHDVTPLRRAGTGCAVTSCESVLGTEPVRPYEPREADSVC